MPIELIAAAGYLVHSGALTKAANHAANAVNALGAKAQHALGKVGAKAGAGKGGASASAHVGDAGVSANANNGAASITANIGGHTAHAQAGGATPASASVSKLAPGAVSHPAPANSAGAYAHKIPPKAQPYLHPPAGKGAAGAAAHPGGAQAGGAKGNWQHYAKPGGAGAAASGAGAKA